jgi:predicted nucleic acid-binding protein
VSLVHADASALAKLVRDEPESAALRTYLADADIVSCDLVLAEVPRAIRRAVAVPPALDLGVLLDRAAAVLEALGLVPLDRGLLLAAGALSEPSRALDATQVAAALGIATIDAFVTYDERQAAAARLAGLRTVAPGASGPQ